MFGEQFQQGRVGHTSVQNDHGTHPTRQSIQRGFGFGDHPPGNGAVCNHLAHLFGADLGQNLALFAFDAGNIRQQQQPIRLQGACNGPGSGVAVDVKGFVILDPGADRGDHGDNASRAQIADHLNIHFNRLADETQFRVIRDTNHQIVVFAGNPNSASAFVIDGLHDPFVDKSGQHHFHDFDSGFIGDAFAAHPIAFDAQLFQHVIDHRAAAMHHDGVHAHLSHQHHVAGKFGHCIIVAHGVAAKFDDDNRAGEALQVGQSLGEGAGGGDPVAIHILLLHLLRPESRFVLQGMARCAKCHVETAVGDARVQATGYGVIFHDEPSKNNAVDRGQPGDWPCDRAAFQSRRVAGDHLFPCAVPKGMPVGRRRG